MKKDELIKHLENVTGEKFTKDVEWMEYQRRQGNSDLEAYKNGSGDRLVFGDTMATLYTGASIDQYECRG